MSKVFPNYKNRIFLTRLMNVLTFPHWGKTPIWPHKSWTSHKRKGIGVGRGVFRLVIIESGMRLWSLGKEYLKKKLINELCVRFWVCFFFLYIFFILCFKYRNISLNYLVVIILLNYSAFFYFVMGYIFFLLPPPPPPNIIKCLSFWFLINWIHTNTK